MIYLRSLHRLGIISPVRPKKNASFPTAEMAEMVSKKAPTFRQTEKVRGFILFFAKTARMKLESYSVVSDDKHEAYEFLSEGPNGTIKKVVFYTEIDDNIFNLAFGDWDEAGQKINDHTRSNNNDRSKVLATVALTVMDFMNHHSQAILFATGSTIARTRLYQIGIAENWDEIGELFEVQGFHDGRWEPFEKNTNYHAFTLKAKEKL